MNDSKSITDRKAKFLRQLLTTFLVTMQTLTTVKRTQGNNVGHVVLAELFPLESGVHGCMIGTGQHGLVKQVGLLEMELVFFQYRYNFYFMGFHSFTSITISVSSNFLRFVWVISAIKR